MNEANRSKMKDQQQQGGGQIPVPSGNSISMMRTSRLLRSRNSTPSSSVPDSPRSLDSRINVRARPSLMTTGSPLNRPTTTTMMRGSGTSSAGYESDDSLRFERSNHLAMAQDVMSIKTMLLKLKRVLHETDEEVLLRSETHNPFDTQPSLKNGFFNGLNSHTIPGAEAATAAAAAGDSDSRTTPNTRLELSDLKRQILFLQGQLEDRERTVQMLQEQMVKYVSANDSAHSAPASTVCETATCNAATQTERIRPVSAGPSLFQSASQEEGVGSLVSVNETSPRKSRPLSNSDPPLASSSPTASPKRTPSRLWRRPGEPPSPQRYSSCGSAIPRRANSRTRAPSTPS